MPRQARRRRRRAAAIRSARLPAGRALAARARAGARPARRPGERAARPRARRRAAAILRRRTLGQHHRHKHEPRRAGRAAAAAAPLSPFARGIATPALFCGARLRAGATSPGQPAHGAQRAPAALLPRTGARTAWARAASRRRKNAALALRGGAPSAFARGAARAGRAQGARRARSHRIFQHGASARTGGSRASQRTGASAPYRRGAQQASRAAMSRARFCTLKQQPRGGAQLSTSRTRSAAARALGAPAAAQAQDTATAGGSACEPRILVLARAGPAARFVRISARASMAGRGMPPARIDQHERRRRGRAKGAGRHAGRAALPAASARRRREGRGTLVERPSALVRLVCTVGSTSKRDYTPQRTPRKRLQGSTGPFARLPGFARHTTARHQFLLYGFLPPLFPPFRL